jgi:hypothetical protein
MRKIKVTLFQIILFSLFWLSLCGAEERILSFHSNITIHDNTSLTVKETIQIISEGMQVTHEILEGLSLNNIRGAHTNCIEAVPLGILEAF